ncbi:MAG: hypothetical protein AAF682_14510 [Planctomycetota bacterium]
MDRTVLWLIVVVGVLVVILAAVLLYRSRSDADATSITENVVFFRPEVDHPCSHSMPHVPNGLAPTVGQGAGDVAISADEPTVTHSTCNDVFHHWRKERPDAVTMLECKMRVAIECMIDWDLAEDGLVDWFEGLDSLPHLEAIEAIDGEERLKMLVEQISKGVLTVSDEPEVSYIVDRFGKEHCVYETSVLDTDGGQWFVDHWIFHDHEGQGQFEYVQLPIEVAVVIQTRRS